MSKENNKTMTPKVRFPEFREADEWEEKKLSQVCEVNPPVKKLPEKFTYIDLESVEDGVLLQKKIIPLKDAPSRAQRLLKNGDVIFQTVRPYQKNNYLFQSEDKIDYVASTGYAQLRAYQSNVYLFQYLHNDRFVGRVLEKCTGSNYPAINSSDLAEIAIEIPGLPEQQKIASTLTSLDDLITAQSEKIKALQAHKKGLMQQLFPAEGERAPRVRFGEFEGSGEWEEKTLGDLVDIKSGTSPSNFSLAKAGKYPFLKVEDLNNCEKYQLKSREYTNVAENAVPEKSIIFAKRGAAIELNKIRITICEVLMDSNLMAITPNKSIYTEFLFYLVLNLGLHKIADTSSIPQINNKHILPYAVVIPSKEEQQKIAATLTSLDDLITTQHEKLEALKMQKKGLMQQLFPNPNDEAI
jgi:type I restriction enzyme S subunit